MIEDEEVQSLDRSGAVLSDPKIHHGVVALVTNTNRTRFLLQQKDEDYRPFPLGYSLFGGAVEAAEPLADALVRELREELGASAALLLGARPEHIFTTELSNEYVLSLFEVLLKDHVLESLDDVAVLEGKRGVVRSRDELEDTPFIWELEKVIAAYLDRYDARPGPP